MKTFSVTVALIITGNHRRVFSVRSANIIDAQRRVLSRIKSIMKTTMFEVVSAAEQSVQSDKAYCDCKQPNLAGFPSDEFGGVRDGTLVCVACGKPPRR